MLVSTNSGAAATPAAAASASAITSLNSRRARTTTTATTATTRTRTTTSVVKRGNNIISSSSRCHPHPLHHRQIRLRVLQGGEDDEYMFKPSNAAASGGGLKRSNPDLEERFAVIGDGEFECVRPGLFLFFCLLSLRVDCLIILFKNISLTRFTLSHSLKYIVERNSFF